MKDPSCKKEMDLRSGGILSLADRPLSGDMHILPRAQELGGLDSPS